MPSFREAANRANGAERAADLALEADLDALWIDALHIGALVAPPEDQVELSADELARAQGSADPAARAWEGSRLHNLGMVYVDAADLDACTASFTSPKYKVPC